MARQCIFCTEKATTKEHCIPEWMAGRTGLHGAFLEPAGVVGEGRVERKQNISFKSHRKKLMCAGCQEHFKHLEDAVIPIYERLERADKTTLTPEEQTVLARWTLKTAICCLFADKLEAIPEGDRHMLRQTGAMPPGAWVAFARWRGIAHLSVDIYGEGSPTNPTPLAYAFSLATRRVATKCVVFYAQSGEPTENLFPTQIVQAWPLSDAPFAWPPPAVWEDWAIWTNYTPVTAPLELQ